MKHVTTVLFAVFIFNGFISCASSSGMPQKVPQTMLQAYHNGDFTKSYTKANELVKYVGTQRKHDYYLSLLERGKVALANGNHDQAIWDFQMAKKHFLHPEGFISISEEYGSFFSNEREKLYEVDPHEMLLISPYLTLAYLVKGDLSSAIVERNRAINKINQYIEQSKKKYLENPFSRYLSALIYEMEGRSKETLIEYRKMARRFKYLKSMKKEARKVGQRSSDLVILIDVGLAPYKYEVKFGPKAIRIGKRTLTVTFAYAKMRPSPGRVSRCSVFVDGEKKGSTRLLYDLENTAMNRFQSIRSKRLKNMLQRIIVKLALSAAFHDLGKKTKKINAIHSSLFFTRPKGPYMEKADLRQWTTLPKNIQYLRISGLSPRHHTIKIAYHGGSQVQTVRVKENTVNILYKVIPY